MDRSNYSYFVFVLLFIFVVDNILAKAIIGAPTDKKLYSSKKEDQSNKINCEHIVQDDLALNLLPPSDYNKEVGPWRQNSVDGAGLPFIYHFEFVTSDIQEVNDLKQTVQLEMYFIVYWLDQRININKTWYEMFEREKTEGGFLAISLNHLEYFWTPDVEVYGVNKFESQNILKPMASLKINKEGMFRYSTRVNIIIACRMDFMKYPFDTQKCNFRVGSYTNHAKVVNCTSKFRYDANDVQRSLQYTTNIVELPSEYRVYRGFRDEWAHCGFRIELQRNKIQMIFQVHVTSTALVIVSWFSFVVNPNCIPGRMGTLITVFLVLINIFIGVKNSSPRSNGLNAADVFLVTCIGNVFAALLEYAMDLILYGQKEEGIPSFGNTNSIQVTDVTPTEESRKTSTKYQWNLIDKLSLFLFPTSFTLFLFIYFHEYIK